MTKEHLALMLLDERIASAAAVSNTCAAEDQSAAAQILEAWMYIERIVQSAASRK